MYQQDLVYRALSCVVGNLVTGSLLGAHCLQAQDMVQKCMLPFPTCDKHRASWDLWHALSIFMNGICYPAYASQLRHLDNNAEVALFIFLERETPDEFLCS